MPKFNVLIVEETEYAVTVEADTAEEAEEKAVELRISDAPDADTGVVCLGCTDRTACATPLDADGNPVGDEEE